MTWYSCEEKFDLKRTEKEKLFDLFFYNSPLESEMKRVFFFND